MFLLFFSNLDVNSLYNSSPRLATSKRHFSTSGDTEDPDAMLSNNAESISSAKGLMNVSLKIPFNFKTRFSD